MPKAKFGHLDTQNKIIKLLEETKMPVTIEFVARKSGIGWGTARAILLDLVVQGHIRMQKTTTSLIFSSKK